jgi:hypothetical protein
VICSKTGRSAEILRCSQAVSHPVRPHRRGGAELDGGAFLRSPTSTLVDLFAPRRYQVSHRVHTLLSRLAPEPDRLRRIEEARRTGRSQPVAEVYSGRISSWSRRENRLRRNYRCRSSIPALDVDYDCLAASRLARYSRSPSSTGLKVSYLNSASELSFDLVFANLAVTFTAALATK